MTYYTISYNTNLKAVCLVPYKNVSDQIILPLFDVDVDVEAGNMTMGSEEASPASISTCTTAVEAANSWITAV